MLAKVAPPSGCEVGRARTHQGPVRLGRVKLLKRMFGFNMQHCSSGCAGKRETIAAIPERTLIEKIQ